MADAIERLDGTREKFIGDAVFAIFGWPRAHDDDPVRAALAALAIRAALREPDDGGEPLEVRIGLATGEVVAAPGSSGAGDLSVTGEAITTAARIQSLARPGEILLDEATVRGGRERLAVDDRGSVVLRGQSSVVRLYALAGEVGLASTGTRHVPVGPLVGRAPEVALLRRALEDTKRTGLGTAILITGDSGMGKSRLLAALEPEARRLGYAWTWTENVSYGRSEPFRFARMFAQAVADGHGVDSGAFVRKLLFTSEIDESTAHRFGGAIAAIAKEAAFYRLGDRVDRHARRPCRDGGDPRRGRRRVCRSPAQRRRPARRRGRRRSLDRSFERRDGRPPGEDGGVTASRGPGDDAPRRRASLGRPPARRARVTGRPRLRQKRLGLRRSSRAPRSTPTTHSGSTIEPRETRSSSARPSEPRSRTARSSSGTAG